ncbi:MAG: methylase [Firmicutes bacterium]|nr:methylase [Bacillota bacterium]
MSHQEEKSIGIPEEKLINSRKRVRKHGEVFTPRRIVRKMLDMPAINEASQALTTTFLEPGVGEGVFLVEILNRKLHMVERQYGESLVQYENYSLLALSTLYGIELLEDNVKVCAMNLYQAFYDAYYRQLTKFDRKRKPSVVDSARLIIAKNIVQGDFLKKTSADGYPVVFSEWKATNLEREPRTIMVQRTEYTLPEIEAGIINIDGSVSNPKLKTGQLPLPFLHEDCHQPEMRYLPAKITLVYREEQEQIDG